MALKLLIALQFFLFNRNVQGEDEEKQDARLCLRIAETDAYYSIFKPKGNSCKGWFCWQSQLTMTVKSSITQIINKFRNREAEDILNMNKLVWHWALEQEALRASETCSREHLELYEESRNIPGLGFQLKCENGCIKEIHTLQPSQVVFLQLLKDALPKNGLNDFDANDKFRRANAMYFGCSLVVRTALSETTNAYEDIYHFVCVFCTTESEMTTIYKNATHTTPICPPASEYGTNDWYPRLCETKGRNHVYLCAPRNPCPKDGQKPPLIWRSPDPGLIVELIMLQTHSGPRLLVNETTIKGIDERGLPTQLINKMNFDRDGYYLKTLSYYPQIPKYLYYYDPSELEFYNEEVKLIGSTPVEIINPNIIGPTIIYKPMPALEGNQDAWCCGILFVLSCIPTVILIIIIYITLKKFQPSE